MELGYISYLIVVWDCGERANEQHRAVWWEVRTSERVLVDWDRGFSDHKRSSGTQKKSVKWIKLNEKLRRLKQFILTQSKYLEMIGDNDDVLSGDTTLSLKSREALNSMWEDVFLLEVDDIGFSCVVNRLRVDLIQLSE